MDVFTALEDMALEAERHDEEFEPSEEEINRWQNLFSYTDLEAVEKLKTQKRDYSRVVVSNEQWDMVKLGLESSGWSRDAYEHWIRSSGKNQTVHSSSILGHNHESPSESSYLLLLEGPLSTPESVQHAANLPSQPQVLQGKSEERAAVFCRIDGDTKLALETWLSQQKAPFKPTFVRISKARKELAATSIYPTLGLDSTLPQYRASSDTLFNNDLDQGGNLTHATLLSPKQEEYPVWYFFYGKLGDSDVLSRLLSPPEGKPPVLVPATVSGGVIETWGSKYKALVNGNAAHTVDGSAYNVISEEQEEALMLFETETYEVVRCRITMADLTVQGLTFRFVGAL